MFSATDPVISVPDAPASVLLLVPALSHHDSERCVALTPDNDGRPTTLLGVTFAQSPEHRIDAWRRHTGERPDDAVILAVGRSDVPTETPDWLRIETVESPPSLTELGVRISNVLSEWEGDRTQTAVCFRSLTALLQYTDCDTVCQFLDAVTDRIDQADAVAHFHASPDAHDESVIEALTARVDAVVETDDAGEPRLCRQPQAGPSTHN